MRPLTSQTWWPADEVASAAEVIPVLAPTASETSVLARVSHATWGVSGAGWACYREGAGFNLKCLGSIPGKRWLAAITADRVGMVSDPDTAASVWQIYIWARKPKDAASGAAAVR